jgi:hypothetical protein
MQNLPALNQGQLHLILVARATQHSLVNALIARRALAGPVRVLDGGNSFRGHHLARELRRGTPNLKAALENVHIARAFTCYQVATLLNSVPEVSFPTMVLELLTTFYDESVPEAERRRLLATCLAQLRRLSQRASVAVSISLPSEQQSGEMLETVRGIADQIWELKPPPVHAQMQLF